MSKAQDSLNDLVERCQILLAHAWVVRAFVRHSDEVEDFPDLGGIGRAVFDISRALETRIDDPPGYFKMLSKKVGKFRQAVEEFAVAVPAASSHTNFAQAVISVKACADGLARNLKLAQQIQKAAESDSLEY